MAARQATHLIVFLVDKGGDLVKGLQVANIGQEVSPADGSKERHGSVPCRAPYLLVNVRETAVKRKGKEAIDAVLGNEQGAVLAASGCTVS